MRTLYQAHTAVFPIRYRAERDPFRFRFAPLPGVDDTFPRLVDLNHFNKGAERRVDHVLIAGDMERTRVYEFDRFRASLARDYVVVRQIERPGPFRLYRHKDVFPPSGG